MTFIKSLRRDQKKKGQATLEYFILFSIMAILTIISLSSFFPKIQTALQGNSGKHGLFQEAVLHKIDIDNDGK